MNKHDLEAEIEDNRMLSRAEILRGLFWALVALGIGCAMAEPLIRCLEQ